MICRRYCLENGLIMPPLVMTYGPVDDMVALVLTCLDLSHRGVKQRGWLAQVLDADA
jgi:putrescine---pyruvate transaminase